MYHRYVPEILNLIKCYNKIYLIIKNDKMHLELKIDQSTIELPERNAKCIAVYKEFKLVKIFQ